MRVLIGFATTDGHTGDLARFAAHRLIAAGHEIELFDTAQSGGPDPVTFDAALLLGSVHLGRYQSRLDQFARRHHAALNAMPSAFISVSLSAAGDNAVDLAGLNTCLERFERETGWRPAAIHQAAGAMRFTRYGPLVKLAIRFIASRRGRTVKTSQDYDLTDYAALAAFIDAFASRAREPGHEATLAR